jgi:PIN domain nuclease of toxin-antitoxin system
MQPLLWDTCAAIWIFDNARLSQGAVDAIDQAYAADVPCYLSPITAWEVGQLVSRRRLQLLITPERWFARMCQIAGVNLADLSPDVLIASSFLPGRPPRDPADRIIVATARDLGATIVTRDRALLDYGGEGHVGVLEC